MGQQVLVEFIAYDAGLNPDLPLFFVQCKYLGEMAGYIHHDAIANTLPCKGGSGCPGDQPNFMGIGMMYQLDNIIC